MSFRVNDVLHMVEMDPKLSAAAFLDHESTAAILEAVIYI